MNENTVENINEKLDDGKTLFGVFFNDDTMYNYYFSKEEANDVVSMLNKEDSHNKCKVKTFSRDEIEK